MTRSAVWPAFRDALVMVAAVLAAFVVMYALCAHLSLDASPAILAAALTLGLARHETPKRARSFAVKLVALPLLALAAGAVGATLLTVPALGAVLFSFGVALSIWLRRFGERAATIGRAIALPFVMMLVVPVRVDVARGPIVTALFVIAAGVVAFAFGSLATYATARIRGEADTRTGAWRPIPRPHRDSVLPAQTRMALQMLVSLLAAFAIGMPLFAQHWPWVVLSAFIVCSGALGRGDAIYKGVLRFGGAVAGTLLAALLAGVALPTGPADAALIFTVLFVGVWLRPINYAYWAACATLLFALLQGAHDEPPMPLFLARLLCVAAGALCAIAATWFVYPIRTEHIVRRRVADLLHALYDLVKSGETAWETHRPMLDHHAAQLDRVAPAMLAHRRLFRSAHPEEHPATLLRSARDLLDRMRDGTADRERVLRELNALRDVLRGPKSGRA